MAVPICSRYLTSAGSDPVAISRAVLRQLNFSLPFDLRFVLVKQALRTEGAAGKWPL